MSSPSKESRLTILEGAQDTELSIRVVPDKVIVVDIDDGITKGEVERAALAGIGTVNDIQVRVGHILGRGERGNELLEDGRGQRTERVSTVEQHRLAVASGGGGVHIDDGSIGLVDCNAVDVEPETCVAVGRLGGGDDGALGEVARVFLGVDTAEDDRTCTGVSVLQAEERGCQD